MNAGDVRYRVTAIQPPAFLYENPDNYDPENVLQGFMRGYFLVRISNTFTTAAWTNIFLVLPCDLHRAKQQPPRSFIQAIRSSDWAKWSGRNLRVARSVSPDDCVCGDAGKSQFMGTCVSYDFGLGSFRIEFPTIVEGQRWPVRLHSFL